MDDIFRALNDVTRRDILDLLRVKDGQTTSEMVAQFPNMTRFGVIKHLKVLENASLLTAKKEGRYKYHYLNVVPLQETADRWISLFRLPWAQSMVNLKKNIERRPKMKPKHVYVQIIKTTPAKLWDALTNPQITPLYYYGTAIDCELKPGSNFNYITPDNTLMVGGEVIEAEKPRKLVTSFSAKWGPEVEGDAPSRVIFEIEPQGQCCRLALTHEFEEENATYQTVDDGWPVILAGLKTLLETGEPLNYDPPSA